MAADVAPALLVDLYELTMADVYRREGMDARPATFSLFVRTLPRHRGWLVAAGLDDVLRWLEELRFGERELAALDRLGLFDPAFLDWLGDLRFTGSVRAVPEGTLVFPDEPILEVDAPVAQAQVAETFLLNQVTLQTVLATKAARCRAAAGDRVVVDFAMRRTHGIDAAMKLARVSRIVGLAATSNVAAADRYGLPVTGTMAHSLVQAHDRELDAFRAFAAAYRDATVLLVDTYDSVRGIEHAIRVAAECRDRGVRIRGIRLDSGDLVALARHARRRLDEEGFPDVQIFASGGLDEYEIDRLVRVEAAPIDGFGVGTALAVSDDAPGLDAVYKLTEFDGRPVRKTSAGKATWPGAKQVWRAADWSGDVLALGAEPAPGADHTPLLAEVMRAGRRTGAGRAPLAGCAEWFERGWAALPGALKDLRDPPPYPVRVSEALRGLAREVDERQRSKEAP